MNWNKFYQLRAELGRPLLMAHRGASALLPENTLSAFQQAVTDGANIIETDLHFTGDGEIVVIHDSTLDRTVEASGRVADYSLPQIKEFRIRQPPARQHHVEQVPTLRELLELASGSTALALELKDARFAQPHYARQLVSLLQAFNMMGECAVISFNLSTLVSLNKIEPALASGWITLHHPLPIQPTKFLGPFWPLLLLNPFYVRWAHRLGKLVVPLDPKPEARLGLYLRLGIDVLLTDNPRMTLAAIERKRRPV